MVVLDTSQKALQVSLVPACGFVQISLKFGILHIGSTVLAPVFGLVNSNVSLVETGQQHKVSATYCRFPIFSHEHALRQVVMQWTLEDVLAAGD